MATIANLVVEMSARTQGLTRALGQAQGSVNRFAQQARAKVNQLGKWIAGAFTAAAGAVALFVKQGLDSIDTQAKFARQVGATIDGMRALTEAGEDAGIATGTMRQALDRFNARLGEARRGTGQAKEALDRLGLSAEALSSMDADQRMATLADRMQEMGLDTQETADVLRQFGIRNRELVNLMTQGGDAIRSSREEIEEYGLALNGLDVGKLESANDAWRRIGRIMEAIRNRIVIELAPTLQGIAQYFTDAARESRGFANETQTGIDRVVNSILFAVDAGDGFIRVVQVAGRGMALFAIEGQLAFAKVAEAIYSGPIDAINFLIKQWNRIPGMDLGEVGQFDFVKDIQGQISTLTGAAEIAKQDIHELLMEPLGGSEIRDYIDEQKEAAQATNGASQATRDLTDAAAGTANALRGLLPTGEQSSAPGVETPGAVNDGEWWQAYNSLPGMNSIVPQSAEQVAASMGVLPTNSQSSAPAKWMGSSSEAAAGGGSQRDRGRNLGTLTLKSDKGGEIDVEANDESLTKWLADTLSGTAAASSSR